MKNYGEIICNLRNELRGEIVNFMKHNNLKEIDIEGQEVFVIWFNKSNEGVDSEVVSIELSDTEDDFKINVYYDEELLTIPQYEVAYTQVEFLSNILYAINNN